MYKAICDGVFASIDQPFENFVNETTDKLISTCHEGPICSLENKLNELQKSLPTQSTNDEEVKMN